MLSVPHVLAAVDFSPSTDLLLETIAEMRPFGVERVTLLYVMPVRYPAVPPVEHRTLYEELLGGAAARLRAEGFRVEARLDLGDPALRIPEIAAEVRAHLLLLGSRGHNLLSRLLIGSTAAEVVRRVEIPVLLARFEAGVPASGPGRFRRVLLATDGSEAARAAEQVAQDLSSVAEHTTLLTVLGGEGMAGEPESRALLEQVARGFEGSVSVRVEHGRNAADVIRRVAREEGATLVVVGRRGLGEAASKLVGSTAEAVAARVGLPVLMVPADHP
jgi:nucleotide-binding universal stress UspA family protein